MLRIAIATSHPLLMKIINRSSAISRIAIPEFQSFISRTGNCQIGIRYVINIGNRMFVTNQSFETKIIREIDGVGFIRGFPEFKGHITTSTH